MGLDISVYKNAKKVTDPDEVKYVMEHPDAPSEGAYEKGYRIPYLNDAFESRFEGLEVTPYEFAEEWGFRAGSYSGYGSWRRELAELVGVQDLESFWRTCDAMEKQGVTPDLPFWQLLHFSDCEGAIGPVACKALAKDFAEWEERAVEFAKRKYEEEMAAKGLGDRFPWDENGHSDMGWWLNKYREWKKAFEDGVEGWVAFH